MARFILTLTEDEKRALEQLAHAHAPAMEKGAEASLVRTWLWQAAEEAGIEIERRTIYGDASRFKDSPK